MIDIISAKITHLSENIMKTLEYNQILPYFHCQYIKFIINILNQFYKIQLDTIVSLGNEANKQAMSLEIKYSQKIRVSPTSHFHDRCSEPEND